VSSKFQSRGILAAFAFALMLLVFGVLVDFGYTKPRLDEMRRLEAERNSLLTRINELADRNSESNALARSLSRDKLEDIFDEVDGLEPVAYVGQILSATPLTRLEMTTTGTVGAGRLHRTEISLRVLGRYSHMVDFVRSLETGRRLVTVDAMIIEQVMGTRDLEGRLNLSIYDPTVRR